MRCASPALLAALLGAAAPASGQETAWSIRGYGEVRLYDYLGAETDPYEANLRVRPRLRIEMPEGGSVVFEPELRHAWGRNEELFDDWEDSIGIERLYGEWNLPKADVVLGKQAVNWGPALVFNPTDAFDDVFLRDPWAENSGHPALRATIPLGPTREIVAMLASDDRFEEGLLACRGRATVRTTEVAVTASRDPFRGADLVGLGVKGEAEVGLWLEAAWSAPWEGDPFLRAVAGTDYTWGVRDGLYGALQYYHDGSGATDEADYDLAALLRRERSTLARDYGTLTARLAWSDVLTFATLTIGNLDDGSVLSTVYGEYTRIPNVTITAGGTILGGGEGEFNPPAALDPTGLLPDAIAFLWLRYHF